MTDDVARALEKLRGDNRFEMSVPTTKVWWRLMDVLEAANQDTQHYAEGYCKRIDNALQALAKEVLGE